MVIIIAKLIKISKVIQNIKYGRVYQVYQVYQNTKWDKFRHSLVNFNPLLFLWLENDKYTN